ncbi:hypothetical protein QJS66_15525 [Kocuria rhizophila]|nr:hypothetical protein QJS66_15525 [Kocuria rhizophila]
MAQKAQKQLHTEDVAPAAENDPNGTASHLPGPRGDPGRVHDQGIVSSLMPAGTKLRIALWLPHAGRGGHGHGGLRLGGVGIFSGSTFLCRGACSTCCACPRDRDHRAHARVWSQWPCRCASSSCRCSVSAPRG